MRSTRRQFSRADVTAMRKTLVKYAATDKAGDYAAAEQIVLGLESLSYSLGDRDKQEGGAGCALQRGEERHDIQPAAVRELPRRTRSDRSERPCTMRFAGRTHPGRRGGQNEDSIGWDEASGLWFVADGMGGHASGDVASRIVKETLLGERADAAAARTPCSKAHDEP